RSPLRSAATPATRRTPRRGVQSMTVPSIRIVLAIAAGASATWCADARAQERLWRVAGDAASGPFDTFGAQVALVGDLNGDGVRDVLVGDPHNATGGVDAGLVRALDGKSGAKLFDLVGALNDRLGLRVATLADDLDGDGVEAFLLGGGESG